MIRLIFFLCLVAVANAQNVLLDSSFATIGHKLFPKKGKNSTGWATVQQSDGKILVAGETTYSVNNSNDVGVAQLIRMKANGTLDSSFATNGIFQTTLNANLLLQGYDTFRCMALQPDGKIIVGGQIGTKPAICRFNPNGQFDFNFGTNGIISFTSIASWQGFKKLLVLPTGSIIALTDNGTDFISLRLKPNGSIDSSFATNGVAITDMLGTPDFAESIALQTDGKVLVGGYSWNNNTEYDFALCRYFSNGQIDTSFGNSGKVFVDFFGSSDYAASIHCKSSGNIVIMGHSYDLAYNLNFSAAEFTSAGVLNTAFGTQGKSVALNNTFRNTFSHSALMPNQEVLLLGISSNFPTTIIMPLVMKLDSAGKFDYTFNQTGYFYAPLVSSYFSSQYSACLQTDGKLVTTGSTLLSGSSVIDVYRFKFLPKIDETANLKEYSNEQKIYCQPVPASEHLQLIWPATENLQLSDLTGRVLAEFSAQANCPIYISVKLFENGYYVIHGATTALSTKIIVQH